MKLEDLKPGDILLCPPTDDGLIGKAIVLLTGGKVSHTAVYCGEQNGELRIAHSDLRGIIYMTLKDFMDEEPGCYVRRLKGQTDFSSVLDAVEIYTDKENPYPVMNFGVLGFLLVANRLMKKTLKNRIFYNFALLIGLKIIKEINKHKYPGKDPMTCSQFASQCYTDAGELYDIKFEKLLLQFKQLELSNDERASLLDYIKPEDENEIMIGEDEIKYVLENEDLIMTDFIHFMQNDTNDDQSAQLVSSKKLAAVGTQLLLALCEFFTGKKPSSVAEAIEIFSSNRNYFVTPDDLLTNTTNLEEIDYFDKTIFS